MLGFYDYTVILTYLSALSAGLGILVSLNGSGHPYIGCFFLMICGLCDAFDGRVARSKKNRTNAEKNFGIQIDSLCDLIAFGVLPACIGNAMIRVWPTIQEMPRLHGHQQIHWPTVIVLWAILVFYILAALIRLAYFNVMEEERQKTEGGARKYYEGLPVTSAALIFPTVLLFQYIVKADITLMYFISMVITGRLFLSKIHIRKPGIRGIGIMIAIGALEFLLLAIAWRFIKVRM